jgi:hypothetical protein
MKKLFWIIVILLAFWFVMNRVNANAQADPIVNRCPAGSYEVGSKTEEPLCKLEPTGCPYGDSIPLGDACEKAGVSQQPSVQGAYTAPDPVDEPVEEIQGK